MVDYRGERMPSPEGHGRARAAFDRAWASYEKAVKPVAEPAARWVGRKVVADLLGFWLMWQLQGGFEGLRRLGMSRSAIYRRVSAFRRIFGAHPDEFEMPGATIDVEAYLRAGGVTVSDPDDTGDDS